MLSDEGEAAMSAIVQSTDPGTAIRAMDEIITRGELSANTLGQLASQAGVEPTDMAATISAAHAGFYNAAMERLEARGVTDSDALDAFVQGNPQMADKMIEGARDLVMGRGTKRLKRISAARSFVICFPCAPHLPFPKSCALNTPISLPGAGTAKPRRCNI